jgi:large subunit ribosomal protein L4
MKANIVNFQTAQTDSVALPAAIFEVAVKPALLAQVIRVYTDNSHQDSHKVQTRGELGRTTAKMYKQKGTGHARHGGKASPTFVGGGVSHGPTGVRPARLKLNKKVRCLSILGSLSLLAKDNRITLASNLVETPVKTKAVSDLLKAANISKKTLLVVAKTYPNLKKSAANIKKLVITSADTLNAYDLLRSDHVIIDQESLPVITSLFVAKKNTEVVEVKATPKKAAAPKKTTTTKKAVKKETAK